MARHATRRTIPWITFWLKGRPSLSATVTLEGHEARVEYDPTESGIPDLMAAVERASNPALAMAFKATVKR